MIVKQSNAELPWPLLKKIAVMQNNKDTEQALCNTPGHTKAYVSVCVWHKGQGHLPQHGSTQPVSQGHTYR